ncbi:hypothetical protein Tco_0031611, partial [Tanacetum coccineum]
MEDKCDLPWTSCGILQATSPYQQDKGSDERLVSRDVDMGDVDNVEKRWVYDEKEWYCDLEKGEFQPHGPSIALIEALEKVTGRMLRLIISATDIEGAFLEEAWYSENYKHHVLREYQKDAILGITNWKENQRYFYRYRLRKDLPVEDVYCKRKIMSVLDVTRERRSDHTFVSINVLGDNGK